MLKNHTPDMKQTVLQKRQPKKLNYELQRKKESEATNVARKSIHKEADKVENDISEAKSGVSVANDLALQAQSDQEKALENKGKGIQRQLTETATAKLKVGNERKRKFEEDLCKLEKKKTN